MMRKGFVVILAVSLTVAALAVTAPFLVLQNKDVQQRIMGQVKKQFENRVSLGSLEPALFPPLSFVAGEVVLRADEENWGFHLKSPELKLELKLLPLLFGKVELRYVHARAANLSVQWRNGRGKTVKKLVLSGWDIEVRNVGLDRAIGFSVQGNFLGAADNARWSGTFSIGKARDGWEISSLKTEMHVKEADLAKFFYLFSSSMWLDISRGTFSWDGNVTWEEEKLTLGGSGSLRQVVYALPSTPAKVSAPADFSYEITGDWNTIGRNFELRKAVLDSPYGTFFFKGMLGGGEGIEPAMDLEVQSPNVNLDRLPEFLVPLDRAIPNKFGFSGEMQMNLFLKRKDDEVSITGSSDLTSSLLSYATYFNKPKGLSMKVQAESVLRKGRVLAGDFSVWLKEMSLKGSIIDFDVETGEGEITFLTNKFSLEGWETIFQPIQKYPMKGWAKLLLNAKGSFADPGGLGYGGTLTLEEAQAVYEELPIRNLDATLEFTNQRASTGRLDFQAQSSPIHLEYIRNLPPYESWSVKCMSPEWYPHEMVPVLESLAQRSKGPEAKDAVSRAGAFISKVLPETQPLKNVALSMSWMGTLFSVQEAVFYVYDGLVKGAGEAEFGSPEPHFNLGIQMEKVNLKDLAMHMTGNPSVEGDFYLLGNFEGDRFQGEDPLARLRGQGEFKIVGGVFNTFDLLGSVGKAPRFMGLLPRSGGVTRFNDVQTNFVVQDGKVITDQLVIDAPRFRAAANGFVSFDGVLNYRVKLALTERISEKLLGSDGGRLEVPLQVYGDIANPKIGLDSSGVTGTVGEILTGGFLRKDHAAGQASSVSDPGPSTRGMLEEAGAALLNEFLGKKTKNSDLSNTR